MIYKKNEGFDNYDNQCLTGHLNPMSKGCHNPKKI